MGIEVLLSVPADAFPDRIAATDGTITLSYAQLDNASTEVAATLLDTGAGCVAMLDTNSPVFPVLFFAAAKAGIPLVPLNYRLSDDRLQLQLQRLANPILVADTKAAERLGASAPPMRWSRDDLLNLVDVSADSAPVFGRDGDDACLLFTSGTTGEPKMAVLTHDNLTSYILSTVEPLAADETDAVLVSVPPYHIAGLAAVLSSVFAARTMVYLESFGVDEWIDAVTRHGVTQAMVVPTMLQRILPALEERGETLPGLRNLSYGGGRMPLDVVKAALHLLPHVGFTNAYGLTETSSTICLLDPEDHRLAIASDEPAVAARLGSVGRPVPGIELELRDPDGVPVGPGEHGEVWVRGPQISGAYRGAASQLVDGWFRTRDEGHLDDAGYLFLVGRLDDVIVRGAENISPGEIEDVLREHPSVADVAVVAEPDESWGEVPVAVVVARPGREIDAGQLKDLVRRSLRSSRVPSRIVEVPELPYNETGKLLRNVVRGELLPSA